MERQNVRHTPRLYRSFYEGRSGGMVLANSSAIFVFREEASMCLGVPGKVLQIDRDSALGLVRGKVQFGGITKEVDLTFTPEVQVGEYVVVHVGFAISKLNEQEAMEVFSYLQQLGETRDLELPEEGKK